MSRQRINRPEPKSKYAFIRIIKIACITQLLRVNTPASGGRTGQTSSWRPATSLTQENIKKQQRERLESLEAQSQSEQTLLVEVTMVTVPSLLEFYFCQFCPPRLVAAPGYDTSPALSVLPGQRSRY